MGSCPPWVARSHLGRRKWCWRRKSLCWGASPSSLAPSSERESSSLPRACCRTRAAWACLWWSGRSVGSCHYLVSAASSLGVCLWRWAVCSLGKRGGIFEEWMDGTGYIKFSDFCLSVRTTQTRCPLLAGPWIPASCFLQPVLPFLTKTVFWLSLWWWERKLTDDPVKYTRTFCTRQFAELRMFEASWQPSRWMKHLWSETQRGLFRQRVEHSTEVLWCFYCQNKPRGMGCRLFLCNFLALLACQFLMFSQKSLPWYYVWWHITRFLW